MSCPAKKGSGTTIQKADAELHLPDGRLITKVREVTREITGIIGLNRSQFSQIAMIAQGDFRKLLQADTKVVRRSSGKFSRPGITWCFRKK